MEIKQATLLAVWSTLGILELGTYSRCFFRNISILFVNSQKIIARVMEVFIPLNRNICPVSICLWTSWLDFFMVCGEWQACCRSHPSHPKAGDLKCIGWTLQENRPFSLPDSDGTQTQWGQVSGLQCGHLSLYRSILHQEKHWLFRVITNLIPLSHLSLDKQNTLSKERLCQKLKAQLKITLVRGLIWL